MSFFLALALVGGDAEAGKLEDGFRGQPWGRVAVAEMKTPGTCTPGTEPQVGRVCMQTFASASIEVGYMHDQGVFFGVVGTGFTYSDCSTFFNVLTAGWGPGRPKVASLNSWEDTRYWFDGSVGASWNYNRYTKHCSLVVSHMLLHEQVSAPAEEAERAAGEGL
jgi:hypothetical protein